MVKKKITREIEIAAGQNIKEYDYWLAKLSGELVKSCFPFDYRKPKLEKTGMETKTFRFEDEIYLKLVKLSKGSNYTLHIVLVAALAALLNKYTGNDDIIVGTPIYRQKTETGNVYINTLLTLRTQLTDNITFKQLLMQTKQTVLEAEEHQAYPVELLPEKLNMQIPFSDWEDDFPLFDVVLLLRNIHDKKYLCSIKPNIIFSFRNANANGDKHIEGEVEYNSSKYRETTIDRIINHFTKLLSNVLYDIDQQLNSIDILSEADSKQLIFDFNDTAAQYPGDKTIHRLFEEQVERTPDNIAVVSRVTGVGVRFISSVSYRELNRKSNQLAGMLRAKGIEPDSIVGMMTEPSLEMISGILGILKAGGAYLPIDPGYPQERIHFMLADSSAKLLLKKSESPRRGHPIKNSNDRKRINVPIVLNFENLNFDIVSNFVFLASNLSSSELAYVIYTSGTTGKPKGVLIEHRNVVRLMFNDKFLFDFGKDDVWTMFHSYCFDFSVWEMYGALLYGGKLVLISRMTARAPQQYLEILKEEKVTVLNQTPAAFYNLAHHELKGPGKKLNLRYVIFGGEALKPIKLKKWKEKYPGVKLVNMFGITETTVHVTYKEIEDKDIELNISNIGKPIPTLSTYIMDKNLKLVPIGAVGELCVSGEGVGRGYLNRPGLTKEKFVENACIPGQRLYRSGDLARLPGNGAMEYLGRADHQVKVRGFRIEPGEIESQLLKYHEVKEAVVLVRGEDKYLCAYIVLNNGDGAASDKTPDSITTKLREYLSNTLPDYMVPWFFVQLEKIPLTPNGKVDRKALPEPEARTGVEYVAPRDEMEEKLAAIWAKVLDLEKKKIGIDDNFFRMGGHSLKANMLISKIHKEINVRLSLTEIFKIPVIRALSQYIKAAARDKYIAIEPAEKKEYYALSPAQKRLYVFQRVNPDSTTYNIPIALTLEGTFERGKIENAFRKLINRHESLRTSIESIDHRPVQKIYEIDEVEFEIEYYDLATEGRTDTHPSSGFIRPFDLSQAPYLRVGVINTKEQEHILMVDMHHVISDAVSLGIFMEEVLAFYRGETFSQLKLQYKDFSQWQNNQVISGKLKKQEEYWLNRFKGEIPVLKMPTDFSRPVKRKYEGSTVGFEIAHEEAEILRKVAKKEDATMFMVILAIFNILLSILCRQEDIILGTVVAGRRYPELENIIGMFINTLALRNFPNERKTFIEFLREVREKTLEVFDNQDYQLEDLVDKLTVKRDTGRNPLFDVLFSFNSPNTKESLEQAVGAEETDLDDFKVNPYEWGENEISQAKFDMTFTGRDTGDSLFLVIEYSTELFKKETIERFIMYFEEAVSAVTENEFIPLRDITISYDLVVASSDVYQGDESNFEF